MQMTEEVVFPLHQVHAPLIKDIYLFSLNHQILQIKIIYLSLKGGDQLTLEKESRRTQ